MTRAYLAWAQVCVIWGTTDLAIRIALETIPLFLTGAVRWVAAGCLLIAILKLRGERLPTRESSQPSPYWVFCRSQASCLGWAVGSGDARRRRRDENVLAADAIK